MWKYGDVYEGYYINGLREGKGKLKINSLCIYEGFIIIEKTKNYF